MLPSLSPLLSLPFFLLPLSALFFETLNFFTCVLHPLLPPCVSGVAARPQIGYLSFLEALRYCQVGQQYKKPLYPIWVVGR